MPPVQDLGIAHFLAQSDLLARGLLVVLITMSLLSWYLILSRSLQHVLDWRRGEHLSRAMAGIDSLHTLSTYLERHPGRDPMHALAQCGVEAGRAYEALCRQRPARDPAANDLLERDLNDALTALGTRMERGLIVLASIGVSAPYIGLLGTVWGVYHALVSIGASGQGTLDKVAGPVGEALIMTALGLAVAIPAVLAYNGLVRASRVQSMRLNAFANRLLRLVTTGAAAEPRTAPPGASAPARAAGAA
jgi:biopolymer transport protein ExbB